MRKAIILVLVFCSVLLGAQNYGTVGQPSGGPPGGTDDQLLSISNDTLTIEDGNFVVLPQGADSLGRNGVAGQIVFETPTKAPNSSSNLFWNNTSKRLGIGTNTPGTQLQIVSTSDVSQFQLNNVVTGSTTSDGFYFVQSSDDTYFRNWETGSLFVELGGSGSSFRRLEVGVSGQMKFNNYTSAASFPGTEVGYLAFDASGNILSKANPNTNDGLGSSPSTGAILFGLGTTTAGIDATNLFWDNSDKELSIGHASAGAVLDVRSSADVTKSTGFFGANQTSTAFNTTYPGLYVANTSGTTNSYARINFGDGDAATSGAMGVQLINPAANYGNYEFWTRGTEGLTQKMLLTSNGNIGFNATTFGTSADNVIGIGNGVEPTTNPADMVQITAYDVASSSELFVENEGGEKSMLTSSFIDLSKDVSQNVGGVAGTVTYISWDDDAVPHKDANFTHEDATNPTRIQVATTGRYRLNWMIGCDNTGADRFVIKSHYRVNGTTVVTKGRQSNYSRGAALGNEIYVGMNIEINLTAGDYIECGVEVEHTTATYTVNTIQADSYFQMRQL